MSEGWLASLSSLAGLRGPVFACIHERRLVAHIFTSLEPDRELAWPNRLRAQRRIAKYWERSERGLLPHSPRPLDDWTLLGYFPVKK